MSVAARRPRPAPKKAAGIDAPLPGALSASLATLTKAVPTGNGWLHEVKYDGYRILARIEGGAAALFSRNSKDWTTRMQPIADAVAKLKIKSAWLDGEVCVMDAKGRSSFQALQNALGGGKAALFYFLFDVLYLDGRDLRGEPLVDRRDVLERLLAKAPASIRLSTSVTGSGQEVLRQACKLGLEGIVSKRADSTYAEGARTRDWLKVKCLQRQEMMVGGFTGPQNSRRGFGALLLGVYEGQELVYAGKVGTGFDDALLVKLRARLDRLETAKPAFRNPPRGYEARGAHWVKPELVAEVSFTEWTNEGTLRHPSFQGLREDKKASDVVRERPA